MSAARARFIESINGLNSALTLDPLAAGTGSGGEAPGIVILRRGMLVAALIALESFVRDRTTELLQHLAQWPASYDQLPQKLRDAAMLNALSHLQRYAAMLKRQEEDYEAEIISEIALMASNRGPTFGFTKFVAGDFTGNISEDSLKSLLANFQISNCWEAYRVFLADLGYGVPSVKELMNDVVRKRHRSAHVAGYVPAAADITGLPTKLICLGICFDTSMSASIQQALTRWNDWSLGMTKWRDAVDVFFVEPHGERFRLRKQGQSRALRVLDRAADSRTQIPPSRRGRIGVVVFRDTSNVPQSWDVS
jgi:hypothetical protein